MWFIGRPLPDADEVTPGDGSQPFRAAPLRSSGEFRGGMGVDPKPTDATGRLRAVRIGNSRPVRVTARDSLDLYGRTFISTRTEGGSLGEY